MNFFVCFGEYCHSLPAFSSKLEHPVSPCLAGHMAMHPRQIGPTDTVPPCLGLPHWACVGIKRERFEAGNFSVPLSPLPLECVDGATILSRYLGSQAWLVFWLLVDVSE